MEDSDLPLTDLPDEEEDLEDGDTPKAEVPETGDGLKPWLIMAVLSSLGLAAIAGLKKRDEYESERPD